MADADLRPGELIEVVPLPGEDVAAAVRRLFPQVYARRLPGYLPIESGVPLPAAGRPGWKGVPEFRVPWARMAVGDSVLVPGRNAADARLLIRAPMQRYGHRYRARVVAGGVRVWRVE